MKKTELKVGEEYAVFTSPGAVRRFQNGRAYSSDEPMRVKLLAIDAVERTWTRGSFSNSWSQADVKGHKVTVPSNTGDHSAKPTITITIYENAIEAAKADGLKVGPKPDYAMRGGYREAQWTRTFLMLDNAGCFISTWAKYEQDVEDTKKMKERHAEEKRQKRLAHDAEAPAMEAKLAAVLAKLADFGEVTFRGDYIGSEDRYMEVKADGGFQVNGEKRLVDSEEERQVLGGANFKMNLTTLARLLGVDS